MVASLAFRVFEESDLALMDKTAKAYAKVQADCLGGRRMSELGDAAAANAAASSDAANSLAESSGAADAAATALAYGESALQSAESLAECVELGRAYLGHEDMNGEEDKAQAIIDLGGLLLSSAVRQAGAPVNGSQGASFIGWSQAQNWALSYSTSGTTTTIKISGASLYVRKPGNYSLQATAFGIASTCCSGEANIQKYDKMDWKAILIKYLVEFSTAFIVCMMAIGASDFHRPLLSIPVSLFFIVGWMVFVFLYYPIGDNKDVGTWWIVAFAFILYGTFFGLLGIVVARFKPGYPGMLRVFRPFAERRKLDYFDYVRRLLKEPRQMSGKARQKLEMAENTGVPLALEQRLYLEALIKEGQNYDRSYISHMKRVFASLRHGNLDAFFFTQRMWGTLVVSIFSVSFIAVAVFEVFSRWRASIEAASAQSITVIYYSAVLLQQQFRNLLGADLPQSGTVWAELNSQNLQSELTSLSEAIIIAHWIGASIGIFMVAVSWIFLALDFRMQILLARQGVWLFNVKKVKTFHATTYVATQCSNAMITYSLYTFVVTLITLPFCWPTSWKALLWFIENYGVNPGLIYLATILAPIIIKMVAKIYFGKKWLKKRYFFMAFELYEILIRIAASIVTAAVRAILAFCLAVVSLPRMDRSPFPAWVEAYLLLDTGSRSYQGTILITHQHNHPVLRVFAWIMEGCADDAAARRSPNAESLGYVSSRKLFVANRFRKAWFMYKNPHVATYRATVGLDKPRRNLIAQAAKLGCEIPEVGAKKVDKTKKMTLDGLADLSHRSAGPVKRATGAAPAQTM